MYATTRSTAKTAIPTAIPIQTRPNNAPMAINGPTIRNPMMQIISPSDPRHLKSASNDQHHSADQNVAIKTFRKVNWPGSGGSDLSLISE